MGRGNNEGVSKAIGRPGQKGPGVPPTPGPEGEFYLTAPNSAKSASLAWASVSSRGMV
jgi:hypothetical protein